MGHIKWLFALIKPELWLITDEYFQVRSVLQLDRIDKDFRGPLAPKRTDFTFSCNVSIIQSYESYQSIVYDSPYNRSWRNSNREDQRGERYIRGVDVVSWPRGFRDIDLTTSLGSRLDVLDSNIFYGY